MASRMDKDEYLRFLAEGTRTAKLATVSASGTPHVVPVWFVLDGDALVFTTFESSVKARNMRREPRVSLCIDDETPPFAFVRVDGTVELSADAPDLLDWTTRIAERYMGADLAPAYGARNAVAGELLVRVTPTRVTASKAVAD